MAVATFLLLFGVQALAAPPQVVEILEPPLGGAPLSPADVHMEAFYADADDDEHLCSDWQIWTVEGEPPPFAPARLAWEADCASGLEAVHIHLGDGVFRGAYTGHDRLDYATSYRLRVRFKADGDPDEEWSEWSTRDFRTVAPGKQGRDGEAPWKARPGYVVEKVAEGFRLPVNLAMVPDPGPHGGDPLFYVAELYGSIKVVTRDGVVRDYATGLLNYDPNGVFPGSGEQGLTGLAVEPESGDLFAGLVYADGEFAGEPHHEKVIRLRSDARGWTAIGEPQTVLDMKELQGASHQISHIELTPDGYMFVHNGDGSVHSHEPGHNPAGDVESFRGKILRAELDGSPVPGNPLFDASDGEDDPSDYLYTMGHRNPFGGAWRLSDSTYFLVENGPKTDRLALAIAGKDYGWRGQDADMLIGASYNWAPAHAPVNIVFVERGRLGGSGFPDAAMGHAFVTESAPTYASGPQATGKRLVEFALAADGSLLGGPETLAAYTGVGKATAVGLAAGPDGLYFSDLYKDTGAGSPIDRGANVFRVRYCGSACPADSSEPNAPAAAPEVAPGDAEAPRIRRFRVLRKAFSIGLDPRLGAGASNVRRGTGFSYRLSEQASVSIAIRPIARRCRLRAVTRRPAARARCARRGPRGAIRAPGAAGRNLRLFAGRLHGRRLPPGRYAAIARARDRSGNEARPRVAAFRVARR